MVFNMVFIHLFSMTNYVVFSVEINRDLGYSFFNSAPNGEYGPLVYLQIFGFAFVIAGLVLACLNKFGLLRRVASLLSDRG